MVDSSNGRKWRVFVAAVAGYSAVPAFGQAAATPAATDEPVLEEVVVTAQRRVENLQTVAIAATSISGDSLNDKAVARVSDLQYASPSLTVTDAGLTQSVNIRGIGLASGSPAAANGVATYVDGLFQPPIVTMNAFYDLGDVEVLRGPQGTFVGSNSTGGAIFINSRNPELGKFGGYAEASVGNYDARNFQGAINLPAGEVLALRFAGDYKHRDSYYTDAGPLKNEPGRLEEKSGRVGALFKPVENFQALLKIELTERDTGGYAYQPIPTTQYAPVPRPADAPVLSTDPRVVTFDDATKNRELGLQQSLELRYTLSNGVVVRAIGGYQNKRIWNLYDFDGTIQSATVNPLAYPRVVEDQYVRERVWTQEVNVISPTEGRLDWVFGGYVQRNRIDVVIAQPSNGFNTDINIINGKTTRGYFAQAGFKITPRLKLDVGARYSTYDVDQTGSVKIGRGIPIFPPDGLQVATPAGTYSDGRPTGKVSLNWTFTDNQLLYAFVARGYKAGGANSTTSAFGPETVMDYEAGWKATLLDGHLRTNVGAFAYDYNNFQIDGIDPTTGQQGVVNLPKAKLHGLELQMQGKFGGFGFDLGYAYLSSELGNATFINRRAVPPGTTLPQCQAGQQPGTPAVCFDYSQYLASSSGKPMLYSPENTFNAGVDYTFKLPGSATLRPRLNYAYVDSQWAYILYAPTTDLLPSHSLVSAQLTLSKGDWLIEAYGTNLADKTFVTGQFANVEFYNAPREYGLRGSVKF